MVSKALSVGLRGAEFLFTLIALALTGSIIASAFAGNPSIINFNMFVTVFAMLCLIYLILATVKPDFILHPILPLALDTLLTLFFFCGAVALAAQLGVHSCSNEAYTKSNRITNGSFNTAARCRKAQASDAFMWFAFFTFAVSAVFSFLSSRGSANLRSTGSSRGGPNMSQV